ncbi:GNAT family N-acetyltransferase [Bacillus aquiflavi]|uniref:GNAT family N-acetyltransferase n=1 Tax=Bacillus aquiflavi TaxID=2672567 RepID=A0A6B3W2D9_9BACI|nr:GNAT family protein [Bacillus aquiflavi]MBA4537795.1 GNAT family N-acetyltransferase [Bacillus aquiflavi]NEY82051.1 GNAT family N-acetyltransferase [Bacillus aquiflavi]UAC46975.1 GNAT family N-acetyltransferase [Bacillus aquiflavi]
MKVKGIKLQPETERLTLRPLRNQDYERWLEGFSKRLPSQYKYDGNKIDLTEWTQKKFNNMVTKHRELADRDEAYVFSVFRKSDQKYIGKVEFCTIMREEFQWGLLGYMIHNQYWKNGYGTEAVKEGIRMAFQNLGYHRIEAHINLDNTPSTRLAERVGLIYECTRKDFIYEFGDWTDNLVYYMNSK